MHRKNPKEPDHDRDEPQPRQKRRRHVCDVHAVGDLGARPPRNGQHPQDLLGFAHDVAEHEAIEQRPPPPRQDPDPFAKRLNGIKKYVVSSTLESADWNNTTLIKGADAAVELAALKEQDGGTIYAFGSATLVRWLIKEGLLDELQLLVHPVVVGHGQRLFGEGDQVSLKLTGAKTFKTGVIYTTYEPEAK